jgi:hypothetical protein
MELIKRCADFGNNVYTRRLLERDDGCCVTEAELICWVLIVQKIGHFMLKLLKTKQTLESSVCWNIIPCSL